MIPRIFRGALLACLLPALALAPVAPAWAQVSGQTPGATAALQTTTNTNIGAPGSGVAASPATSTGLNGVLKGFWTDLRSLFGAAGSGSAVVITVQGSASGTPAPVTGASLTSIDGKLTSVATTTLQTAGNASLTSIDGKLTTQAGYLDGLEGSVDGIEALLADKASATLQTAGNASLTSIDGKLTTLDGRVDGLEGSVDGIEGLLADKATATLQTAGNGSLAALAAAVSSNKFQVDCITGCSGGGGGSGTEFAEDAVHSSGALGTLALGVRRDTAASLAGTDGDYTAPIFASDGSIWARLTNTTLAVTGTFWQATQPVSGTFWQATQPVSVASLPTPSGASLASNQTTLIGHVDGVEGQLTTLDGRVDGLETAIASSNTKLDSVIAELVLIKTATDPVTTQPIAATTADASTTVTTGGTFQTVFAASATRLGCFIQNPITATETLFVYEGTGTATTAKSINLAPGAAFNCNGGGIVVTGLVQVTATTTAHAFVAKSQ